jgi:hypothetical protein
MLCPRCNAPLQYILTEVAYEEFECKEWLCTNCFVFVQQVYKGEDLVFSLSGELRKVNG